MKAAPVWVTHLPALPGARRHIQGIGASLLSGPSCSWVVPRPLLEVGAPAALLPLLPHELRLVHVPPPATVEEPPARRVAAAPKPLPAATGASLDSVLDSLFGVPLAQPVRAPTRAASSTGPQIPAGPLSLGARVMQALDEQVGLVPEESKDVWDAVARWEPPEPLVLVVDASRETDADDLESLVTRLPATSRQAGLIGQSLRLLVLTPPDGVAPQLLETEDALSRTVEWWWDVVSRLDLLVLATLVPATHVPGDSARAHMEQLSGDLLPEVVAELAGWDLDLAVTLLAIWDGSQAHLEAILTERTQPLHQEDVRWRPSGSARSTRPSQRLLPAFATGAVRAWGGTPRTSLAHQSADGRADDVRRALHLAQQRALTVALEQRRVDCERHFRELRDRTRPPGLSERLDDPAPMEFGEMFTLAHRGAAVPSRLRHCLKCLRDARNAVAHLQVVDDEQLRRLAEYRP